MRTSGGAVGPWGVTLLLLTAVVGALLAVHGWSAGRSSLASAAFAGPSATGRVGSHASSQGGSPSPRSSPAAPSGGASPGSGASQVGPLLRSQSYAPYAFLVWPGTPSAAAKTALTGLSVSVQRTASSISVRAGINGQQQPSARSYQGGARVYVIEASLGDEAGNVDYNLGDDGLVVTDAHGRILQ